MPRLLACTWLVLVLFVQGCATPRPENAQPFREISESRPGFATVYIYRPHHDVARAVWPEVFINEQKVVGLRDEGYTVLFVKPGKYQIRTEKSSPLSGMGNVPGAFEIEKEGSYFLKFDRSYNQFTTPAGPYGTASPTFTTNYERWTLTAREVALVEISKCYFIQPYLDAVSP